jgi:hypothetical protein
MDPVPANVEIVTNCSDFPSKGSGSGSFWECEIVSSAKTRKDLGQLE